MGYYDNVKENVRKESASSSSGSSSSADSGGNFDTLKKAASETDPDENEGDDTPIEVLEEDGLSRNPKRDSSESRDESRSDDSGESIESSDNPFNSDSEGSESVEADLSNLEDKLDTIIDQNEELIKILKSFAQ